MDSRQVYRGMDIGTDKVRDEARSIVPHHGLDLVEPDHRYSAGRFARDARRWIREIRSRGALPVLAGGTGFFLKSVMEPIFTEPSLDAARLEALRRWLSEQPTDTLSRWVTALDPERAELAIEGGPQRMSRTLEVALLSGVPLSTWHRQAPPDGEGAHGGVLLLERPRDEIDARIRRRVPRMFERGLADEVRALLDAGYTENTPGMTGTGYREIARHLRDEISLEQAVEEIAATTRRYARRQLTWFRHQLPQHAVRVDASLPVERQADMAIEAMEAAGLQWPGTP